MSIEDIKECLTHPKKGKDRRTLLSFCNEAKTYAEMGRCKVRCILIEPIADLKKIGALVFADGKYGATKEALDVLKSLD